MHVPLDSALERLTIARRQHMSALKELAGTERANLRALCPIETAPVRARVEATRQALERAELDLADSPARNVWAFLIKVEALAEETMSPAAAESLRRDAGALLDAQSRAAAA